MLRQLPNALTASRGLAGLGVAALVLRNDPTHVGFWLFIGAILTDLVDGALARKLGAEGEFGRWLDPISDKVLTNTCWAALWFNGWVTGLVAGPLILRDVITGIVYISERRRGRVFAVNHAGRVALSLEAVSLSILIFHGPWIAVDWQTIGTGVGWSAIGFSLVAVTQYLTLGPSPQPATAPGKR